MPNLPYFCPDNAPPTCLRLDIGPLIARLRQYNAWRRGADLPQPCPTVLGIDLASAADLLEAMSQLVDTVAVYPRERPV